jgi:hypothetical protein
MDIDFTLELSNQVQPSINAPASTFISTTTNLLIVVFLQGVTVNNVDYLNV